MIVLCKKPRIRGVTEIMKKNSKPTEEHLIELYDAAAAFKKAEPWKWLYDSDIISVENPKDKTMAYCSVMGRAGEHYALGVYLGTGGLYGFNELLENGDNIPLDQALHLQNCLMCSFEDRNQLTDQERKQIKELGLSFRGRNAWPLFRRHEPGYYPWFITDEECIFLIHALKQTLIAANHVLNGQLRMNAEQGKIIGRYSEEKDGKLEWFSKEVLLEIPTVTYKPVIISDEMLIQKLKNSTRMGNNSLQADISYMNSAVQDIKGERPYYPRVFFLVDQNSGIILDFKMFKSISDDVNITLNRLSSMLIKIGLPKEIQVRSEEMASILVDLCEKIGIKLKLVNKLPAIEQVLEKMPDGY
jgi:hypothetical protein